MIRFAIIGLLFLLPLTAYSSEPSVAPVTSSGHHQTNSKKSDQHTQSDDRGTKESPAFVKIIPTEPTQAQAEQEKNEKHEKSFNEKAMVYFTGVLTLATVILAFFTYRLWSATVKMSKDAEETSKRQTADTIKSLDLTQKSIDLAREKFISTHRPQLIVRNVNIKPPHPLAPDIIFEDGKPITIEWSVVNIGDTPAVIVESNATALMSVKSFSSRIEHSTVRDTMGATKFLAGEHHAFVLIAEDIVFPNYGTFSQLIMPPAEKIIYFFGFIEYKDAIGTIRRTAFCRSYDPVDKRFLIIDDPDYEYAD